MTFRSRLSASFLAGLSLIPLVNPAQAQEAGASFAFPGVFGAASAVAPAPNSGFAALTYVTPREGIAGFGGDGDAVFGYTIGNPVDAVAATLAVNITGLDPFGDSGVVNISLSRLVASSDRSATFLGVTAGNLAGWGDALGAEESYSAYISHLATVPFGSAELPVQITGGYGNRTTLSSDGLATVSDGAFVGLGLGVAEFLSLSASATATQINLGGTLTIPGLDGFAITGGVFDVMQTTERQQASVTVSYSF